MVKTTINLDARIRDLAKKHGLSMSFESRKAITIKVEKLEKEEQEFLQNDNGEQP